MSEPIWQLVTILLVAAAILEGVMLVAVMRQVGSISLMVRPHMPRDVGTGPQVGTVVERPKGVPPDAGVVVLFVSPGCVPCQEVLPSVPQVMERYPEIEFVAAVVGHDEALRRRYAQELGSFAREDQELWQEWEIDATPFAVAIDRTDRVRLTGVANTTDQLEALAQAALLRPVEEEPGDVESGDIAKSTNGSDPLGNDETDFAAIGTRQERTADAR